MIARSAGYLRICATAWAKPRDLPSIPAKSACLILRRAIVSREGISRARQLRAGARSAPAALTWHAQTPHARVGPRCRRLLEHRRGAQSDVLSKAVPTPSNLVLTW